MLVFIQTGGTIDKDYPRAVGGYAFEIAQPASGRVIRQANVAFLYRELTCCKKDSQNITDADRTHLLHQIEDLPEDEAKVVVTHGSDTLIETACFLERNIEKYKTVVLTGSLKPEKFVDSDATFNLGFAVGCAQVLGPGVYVAMSGMLHKPSEVARDATTGRFIAKDV
mmetsp:Transcript_13561/g.49325  ORF Transcript_13561/g.49325 Transcript_13561/m.49325 type:complete len:168 (+) Transcript_13561:52-555(+)